MRRLVLLLAGLVLSGGFALAANPLSPSGATARFEDGEAWLHHALRSGATARSTGCVPTGATGTLTTHVLSWGSTGVPLPAGCVEATHLFSPSDPGRFVGAAEVWTSRGVVRDVGVLDVHLIPFDTSTVPGFPPLEQVAPPTGAASCDLQLLVRPDGSVKAYRVSVGGQTALDTLADATIETSDTSVQITFSHLASRGEMRVNGAVAWSGLVGQADASWWHLVPVEQPFPLGS